MNIKNSIVVNKKEKMSNTNFFTKLNIKENIWDYICILSGIILVIVALVILTDYKQYYGDMSPSIFGADFYTEIHDATVRVVNTARNIYEMIRIAIGTFMLSTGVIEICVFAKRLKFHKTEESSSYTSNEPCKKDTETIDNI